MKERTYKIIMACKSHGSGDVIDAVRTYMAKECMVNEIDYEEVTLSKIMLEAMYDYLDSCDRPSSFMREFMAIFYGEYLSIGERIARAFLTVRVRNNDGKYVNGFGEWAN